MTTLRCPYPGCDGAVAGGACATCGRPAALCRQCGHPLRVLARYCPGCGDEVRPDPALGDLEAGAVAVAPRAEAVAAAGDVVLSVEPRGIRTWFPPTRAEGPYLQAPAGVRLGRLSRPLWVQHRLLALGQYRGQWAVVEWDLSEALWVPGWGRPVSGHPWSATLGQVDQPLLALDPDSGSGRPRVLVVGRGRLLVCELAEGGGVPVAELPAVCDHVAWDGQRVWTAGPEGILCWRPGEPPQHLPAPQVLGLAGLSGEVAVIGAHPHGGEVGEWWLYRIAAATGVPRPVPIARLPEEPVAVCPLPGGDLAVQCGTGVVLARRGGSTAAIGNLDNQRSPALAVYGRTLLVATATRLVCLGLQQWNVVQEVPLGSLDGPPVPLATGVAVRTAEGAVQFLPAVGAALAAGRGD